MYKTVRHGENSLQYKILAQQEEGLATLKCRRPPRTVTAKLITVIILLIVGIIASAVLVPLVLTNDFIALTGTFQKFSVSTLRRSHSGNHVVVIAKKPYGWSGLRSGVPSRSSNASRVRANDFGARDLMPATDAAPTATTDATKAATGEGLRHGAVSDRTGGDGRMEGSSTKTTATTASSFLQSDGELGLPKLSPTTSAAQKQNIVRGGAAEVEGAPSTAETVWFEPVKKWGLGSSDNFFSGMSGMVTNPVSIFGGFLFVVIVVVMFFVLRKTLPKRRILTEKEAAESKEDKTRLLRPSSDHDEE